jgi:hypothetical protein
MKKGTYFVIPSLKGIRLFTDSSESYLPASSQEPGDWFPLC